MGFRYNTPHTTKRIQSEFYFVFNPLNYCNYMWIMVWCDATIMVWKCLEEGKLSLGKSVDWNVPNVVTVSVQYGDWGWIGTK